ncbi:MAG: hypothetical protein OWU33_09740 [Firmicutes bacterium]|nr:hypothetical protein [Bacillota bacterium]
MGLGLRGHIPSVVPWIATALGALMGLSVPATVNASVVSVLPGNGTVSLTTPVSIKPAMFGANVSGWDPWMLSPSGIEAISAMHIEEQQFPNAPGIYNWATNESFSNGQWYPIPVSLTQWAEELRATHSQGLYIVPYGFNPSGTGGATVAEVEQLTSYIVSHHDPVNAMVIGSEEYGAWSVNLHKRQTAVRYAQLAAQMAQAIHRIDPAMAVGVDYDLPYNVGEPNPSATLWNRTVIAYDAPYVQFLSVHMYPINQVQPNAAFLQSLYSTVNTAMAYIKHQVARYAGSQGRHLAIWFTEYNPYGLESEQSTQPVFASALIQSYLELISMGARQVDWWSLYGDAYVPQKMGTLNMNTPLATGTPFATTGLLSEAIGPQPTPANHPYLTATTYAAMTSWVERGANLQTDPQLYTWYRVFAARISHGTWADWIFVNDNTRSVTIHLATHAVVVPSTAWTVVSHVPSVVTTPQGHLAPRTNISLQIGTPTPQISGVPPAPIADVTRATWNPGTATLTVEGSHLGSPPPLTASPGVGQDEETLMVSDLTTNTNYGWSYPGMATDWDGITVVSWTSRRITITLNGPQPAPGDRLQITWWQHLGYMDVPTQLIPVTRVSPSEEPLLEKATYSPQLATVTIVGRHFGSWPVTTPAPVAGDDQEELAVTVGGQTQYGYANPTVNTDWYGMTITSWTPTRIVLAFAVPPAHNEPVTVTWMPTGQTIVAALAP